jgi:iron(III) transport system substrate-binding protein
MRGRVTRGGWRVERGAWSVERGTGSLERGTWNVERRAWNAEHEQRRGGQSRRDCIIQPRVASRELPWVSIHINHQPCKGCITAPEGPTPQPSPTQDSSLHRLPRTSAWCVGTLVWGFRLVPLLLAALILLAGHALAAPKAPAVIAYCAQDQVYAEPIFAAFEKQTGIKVRAVFDSEAVKTVGLANRLLAERSHPQCDLFWGNEEMRTRQLAARDVFRVTNGWAAFGYRSRRMVINTNKVPLASAPRSLLELTNAAWRGKLALAYPQFGTTATQFHALRQYLGDQQWQVWCRALAANKPFLVDGNSMVVKFVGGGEASVGLSDSDDIAEGQANGLPIAALPMTAETLLIPNTVAVIRGAAHPEPAQKLFEYLQRPEVVQHLVAAHALEDFSPATLSVSTLHPQWDAMLRDLDSTTAALNEVFLR